jgi:hypothetical protein
MRTVRRQKAGTESEMTLGKGRRVVARTPTLANIEDGGPIGSAEIRELQRTAGNRATTQLLARGGRAGAVQRSKKGARNPTDMRS